ncbi:hypothetical protein F4802DRAFT_592628 [Xylaria palmicola]|nr:hypothetical protein F4802DRAFT_592628 [Xylaria palmicola]
MSFGRTWNYNVPPQSVPPSGQPIVPTSEPGYLPYHAFKIPIQSQSHSHTQTPTAQGLEYPPFELSRTDRRQPPMHQQHKDGQIDNTQSLTPSNTTSAGQSSIPVRRAANRATQACTPCRMKKSKCNEKKPCTNCIKGKVECIYSTARGTISLERLSKKILEKQDEILNILVTKFTATPPAPPLQDFPPSLQPLNNVLDPVETLSHRSISVIPEARSLLPSTPSANTPKASPSEIGEQSSTALYDKAEWHPQKIQHYVAMYKKTPLYSGILPVDQLDDMVDRFVHKLPETRSQAGSQAGIKRKRSLSVDAAWDGPPYMDVDYVLVLLVLAIGKFYANKSYTSACLSDWDLQRCSYAYFDLGKNAFVKCDPQDVINCIRANALIGGYLCEIRDQGAGFAHINLASQLIRGLLLPGFQRLQRPQVQSSLSTDERHMRQLGAACFAIGTYLLLL